MSHAQSMTLDEAFEKLSKTALKVKADRDELLRSLKAIMNRVEGGDLVRDTSKDSNSDWTMRMVVFVKELQDAQAAITEAERAV